MTQKYLRITMPDCSKWDVPLILIVKDRAKYYGEKDIGIRDDELISWAVVNMDWADVVLQAQKVIEPKVDYREDGWITGDKEIIIK